MTETLFDAIERLVPAPARDGNWDDVLARVGESVPTRRRRSRRLTLLVFATLSALAVVVLATPAFGLRSALLDLIGRTNVPFATSKPAPNRIKKHYLDLSTRLASLAFQDPVGMAIASEARQVGTFTINGHARRLWVDPTKSGGFCYEFEKVAGSCVSGAAAERTARPLSVDVIPGPLKVVHVSGSTPAKVFRARTSHLAQVTGTIRAPGAALLQIAYADGTRATIPFVWVSKPIAAGFFAYDIPADHLTHSRHPTALVVTNAHGKVLARDTIFGKSVRQVFPRVRPTPSRPFVARTVPTSPSRPLQRGRGDGTSVVVGRNGFASFDLRATPTNRIPASSTNLSAGCFRITKEFGIPGTSGANGPVTRSQTSPEAISLSVGSSGPFDGCEISTGVGHLWPDRLGSHAAVEIPLTAVGRTYFADRAVARDLALFIHSGALKKAWSPGGKKLVTHLAARFGTELARLSSPDAALPPGRLGYSLVPDGAVFVERSATGKRFTVTITHHWISQQNLAPYTQAYLFWKRS